MPKMPCNSPAKLFEAGNYTTVAMSGDPDDWRTYAALGLLGKASEAIEGLSRFDAPEARFFSAVANWIDGDETTAARILEKIRSLTAQNLLALIRKPQIRVLAQLPWDRRGPHDILTAVAKDEKFNIQNFSFHQQDLPNEPFADIHKFYDPHNPPDFYICAMVEWHLIPPNLQQLPCPVFGATADYDAHIQAVLLWLYLFDELIVSDPNQWREVKRLTGTPACTFSKVYGVADKLPPIPTGRREIDAFVSGTVTHPYHPDKARILNQLLQAEDINVRSINGFVSEAAYNALLGRSKASFTYVRYPHGMVTRGLEALSMGCGVVVQKGSLLTLYVGEEDGVLTYEPESDSLVPAMRRILNPWPEFEQRARRGAEIVRREFALSRVASQYLRFLTFLAAKPRGSRQIQPQERLAQKRSILWKGLLPGGPTVLRKLRECNIARWRGKLKTETTPRLVIDMARELVLECATNALRGDGRLAQGKVLNTIFDLYRTGLAHFPLSLVLRFNLIRTVLHFGRTEDVSEALKLGEETLGMPTSSWQIDAMEDVFPWDFFPTFFNYRKYFDLVTEHLAQRMPVSASLVQLILASLHHYVGHHSGSLYHFEKAATLDPDFPFYKLYYAQELIKRGGPGDHAKAGKLLAQLAEDSMLFVEAFELLEQLQSKGLFVAAQFEALGRKVSRVAQNGFPIEGWRTEVLQPAANPPAAASPSQPFVPTTSRFEILPSLTRTSRGECLISVVVSAPNSESSLHSLLTDLEAQTVASQIEIIVVGNCSSRSKQSVMEGFQQRYGNIKYIPAEDSEPVQCSINRGIKSAAGKYLTLARERDRRHPGAFERMAAVLESRPHASLVYANVAVAEKENETYNSGDIAGYYLWPEFNRQLLFQTCYVGPQPLWRRGLHDHYGYFDPQFGSAGDYEFWLRIAPSEKFFHIAEILGSCLSDGGHWAGRSIQESQLARARRWPTNWGRCPAPRDTIEFFVPSLLLALSWHAEAHSHFNWGIIAERDLEDIRGLMVVAKNAMARQDWIVAHTAVRATTELFPTLRGPYLTMSELLKLQGQIKPAEEMLEAASNIDAYAPVLLKRLGVSRHSRGDVVGAEAAFRHALDSAPSDPDALVSLGQLCFESKRYEDACRYFQAASQDNEEDIDAYLSFIRAAKLVNNRATPRSGET